MNDTDGAFNYSGIFEAQGPAVSISQPNDPDVTTGREKKKKRLLGFFDFLMFANSKSSVFKSMLSAVSCCVPNRDNI